jgi:hypothetical protein
MTTANTTKPRRDSDTVHGLVRRVDAKRDEDGHCTVCGLPWPDRMETLEQHRCPPGFLTANKVVRREMPAATQED